MKIGAGLLKIDLIVQGIIGLVYLFTGLFGFVIQGLLIIALLTQLVIGVWQVLSALTITIINKEKKRITYLVSVVCYFIIVGFATVLIEGSIIDENIFIFIIGLVIIPIAFGVWYYLITLKDYQQLSKDPTINNEFINKLEDVLDSDELLNR
jgi:predicted ferric reductase